MIGDLASGSSQKTPVQRQQDEKSHLKLKGFILSAFESFNKHYSNELAEESKACAQQSQSSLTASQMVFKAKFGYRFGRLTDGLLRTMEQNPSVRD